MRYMQLRVFLRGGYQEINEPTIVTKNGYPEFTVFPGPARRTADKQAESPAKPSAQTTSRS